MDRTVMSVLNVIVLLAAASSASGVTDEEYSRFPRLYHLDDYEGCLSRPDGLYCLGTFRIDRHKTHDPYYDMLKVYSEDPHHFNRTLLHRGYCVSERCPSSERNTTLRFEKCGALWGRKRKLRLSLTRVRYCRTHAQDFARKNNPEPLDLPQKTMLAVVVFFLLANLVGTCYDLLLRDDAKRNSLLAVWSLRSNWGRLTASYEDGDPRLNQLNPLQGIRVFLMVLIMATHSGCIHDMLYLHNPRFVEQVSRHPAFMIFMNGTSVVMIFVMLSTFLLAYNLLLLAETRPLSVNMLPYCVIKRVARITPVSLLVIGYAATFWSSASDGPMWATLVTPEAAVCRRKFWAHALYLNNLVDPNDHCLVQTWFLATDMQLYIVASVLTLWLSQRRALALPLLGALLAASCVLNGALAYVFGWKSIMYHVYPSTMHTMYSGVASFYRLYTAPWGSLPASLCGLLLAHAHYRLQQSRVSLANYSWFRALYTVSPALIVGWIVAGNWVRAWTDPRLTAAYVALERPALCLLSAGVVLGLIHGITGFLSSVFSWRGWVAMGRLSLSVLMLHWIINTILTAARPTPIATSTLNVLIDCIATGALSYVAAVPLTTMVEMPVLRTVNVLVFSQKEKTKAA